MEGHTHAIRKKDKDKEKRNNALWVAEQLGIKLHIIDISEEYKDVVLNPKHGYGANLNPCLDCKIFMVNQATLMINKAREFAGDKGFDFIITGEVIGQRPKSQRKETMPIISQESGADDRLLRPLCARNLPPDPAGARGVGEPRMRYMIFPAVTANRRWRWPSVSDWKILPSPPVVAASSPMSPTPTSWPTCGRHVMSAATSWMTSCCSRWAATCVLAPTYKLIISREEGENRFLEGYRYMFTSLTTVSCPGPLALVDGQFESDEELREAAAIVARYSKGRVLDEVTLEVRGPDGVARQVTVKPALPDEVLPAWNVG